jgi:hypothetical protein
MTETKMKNVRIAIQDLIEACRTLGEVRVVAAGSMFATLETDEIARKQLVKANIDWSFD